MNLFYKTAVLFLIQYLNFNKQNFIPYYIIFLYSELNFIFAKINIFQLILLKYSYLSYTYIKLILYILIRKLLYIFN